MGRTENVKADIDKLNSVFESYFTTHGGLTEEQKKIFFGLSCNECYQDGFYLPKETSIENCKQLSGGKNVISLTDAVTMSSSAIRSYVDQYEASNKTALKLAELYTDAITAYVPLNAIGALLYFKLYETADAEYKVLADHLIHEGKMLAILAIPIGIIVGLVSWFYAMKRILEVEHLKNKMIAIIPTKMILSNSRLKKWLKENTGSSDLRHLL